MINNYRFTFKNRNFVAGQVCKVYNVVAKDYTNALISLAVEQYLLTGKGDTFATLQRKYKVVDMQPIRLPAGMVTAH